MADRPADYRDHDHRVEAAFITYVDEHAPEVAVAALQRRYDHVLRRLHGDSDLPEFPVHLHDPTDNPADCAAAALDELAGAQLVAEPRPWRTAPRPFIRSPISWMRHERWPAGATSSRTCDSRSVTPTSGRG